MNIKFKDILPNPYRDLVNNPLREDTIEDLRSSVRATGFWDNVAVRKRKDGKFELGGGHHRIEAAKREGMTEADFIVKKWDESQMIKVKHDEDKARKAFDTPTMIESVRAVVNALAAEVIPPFVLDEKVKKQYVRYAPSFVAGVEDVGPSRPQMAYTALHIAEFLGETKSRGTEGGVKANASVITALDALALIEQQEISEASLKNLPLDNPDPSKPGLIQRVQKQKQRITQRVEESRTHEEKLALDEKRRKEEAEDKERRAELMRKMREANKEEDEKKAKRATEELKRQQEREELRQKAFEESRARLDAKIKEDNARRAREKAENKDLPTRHAVKTMLLKLDTITSERFAFREEVKAMSRDRAVTTNERELLRQAMMRAGDWYLETANVFLPKPAVNPLVEAQQREDAKRKRGHANEQE